MPFLHDLDVVEFHPSLATAMVGRYLADLGAAVTTIEQPDGHPARREPPFARAGQSLLHAYLAHGKTVVRESGSGRDLLRSAHLVLHAYPQTEFEQLTGLRPGGGPPCVSVTPSGEAGPCWDAMPELAVDALSGNLWLNGFPGQPPVAMYGHQTAFFPALAGVVAALAVTLTADVHREAVSALQVQASV
ncbi:MAG: CoA transferase, partial [Dehalococcoidia bacterium]|nr:CoA transferase [Dehalococcoidia bacterium]